MHTVADRKGDEMRYRKLGSSDLEVSEISLGSWLTFAGGVEFEQTRACTDAAFEAGINLFDTANVYGRGTAESAWGEILSKRPRDSYVLATKVWGQMSDDPRPEEHTSELQSHVNLVCRLLLEKKKKIKNTSDH